MTSNLVAYIGDLRERILISQCLYYIYEKKEMTSDSMYDSWVKQLVQMQNLYKDASKEAKWGRAFIDFPNKPIPYSFLKHKLIRDKALNAIEKYDDKGNTKVVKSNIYLDFRNM